MRGCYNFGQVPSQVDSRISDLMFRCWKVEPRDRPDFESILMTLAQLNSDLEVEGGDDLVESPPGQPNNDARESRMRESFAAKERMEKAARAAAAVKAAAAAKAANPAEILTFRPCGEARRSGEAGRERSNWPQRPSTSRLGKGPRRGHAHEVRSFGGRGGVSGSGTGDRNHGSHPPCPSSDQTNSKPTAKATRWRSQQGGRGRGGSTHMGAQQMSQQPGDSLSFTPRPTPSRGGGQRGGHDIRQGRECGRGFHR